MTLPANRPKILNKYFFKRHGVPMTVTQYTLGAQDTYGIETLTSTATSVDYGIISYSRRSLRDEDDVQGSTFIIEAEIYLLDEDFANTGLSAPLAADQKRPMVTVNGVKYDVIEIEDPIEIGIVRMVARKKRGG